MMLRGTEVKAIRDAKANLQDGYCYFKKGELYIKNLHISEYKLGTYNNHIPTRERKLLLQAKELKQIEGKVKERGMTIIPVQLSFNERGLIKLEIALAKGKKLHDKRNTLQERDARRDLNRINKLHGRY